MAPDLFHLPLSQTGFQGHGIPGLVYHRRSLWPIRHPHSQAGRQSKGDYVSFSLRRGMFRGGVISHAKIYFYTNWSVDCCDLKCQLRLFGQQDGVFLLAFSLLQVCEIIESPLFLKLNPMTKHTDVSFSFGNCLYYNNNKWIFFSAFFITHFFSKRF